MPVAAIDACGGLMFTAPVPTKAIPDIARTHSGDLQFKLDAKLCWFGSDDIHPLTYCQKCKSLQRAQSFN